MTTNWDTNWIKDLQQPIGELPDTDYTGEFPWYASAWLAKAMQSADKQQNLAQLRQYIQNPYVLHWLLNRNAHSTSGTTHAAQQLYKETAPEPLVAEDEELEQQHAEDLLESVANRAAAWLTEDITAKAEEIEEVPGTQNDAELQGPEPSLPEVEVAEKTEAREEPEEEALPISSRLGNALKTAAENLQKEVTEEDLPALFQPHHTVDYFEAVGVKVTDAKDKLNTQVKSFTQWLKGMKKINYQTGQVDEDTAVTQKANASLQEHLVKTETMADVMIKQGRLKEATAIFTELQLLYPDKSAYFAARLEKLKEL